MMKYKSMRYPSILALYLFAALPLCSAQSILAMADSLYGLNDLLVNGTQYLPSHPRAEGHPFFPAAGFSGGVVFVKGERFDEVQVNYDAEGDQLLLDVSETMPWIRHVVVNELLADSFRMGDRTFVHARTLPGMLAGAGYLEKIYEGRFMLLARHQKKFKAEFNQWRPYGEYITLPEKRLILKDGVLFDVSREKQWLELFSAHRKDLNKFLRKHHIHLRKATTAQLKQVAAFCNGL